MANITIPPTPRQELSMGIRLLILLGMAVVLLIPQSLILYLVHDRGEVAEEAALSIAEPWGKKQVVAGITLIVPYTVKSDRSDRKVDQMYAFFQPDSLQIGSVVLPEIRHRGVYESVVYHSELTVQGSFRPLNRDIIPSDATVNWNEASILCPVSDLVGLKSLIQVRMNDSVYELEPGALRYNISLGSPALSCPIRITPGRSLHFAYNYNLNGSERLYFAPTARVTNVDMRLKWGNPSFTGRFLPEERTVTDSLTTARWSVLYVNTPLEQEWISDGDYDYGSARSLDYDDSDATFGVTVLAGVDIYQKVYRAVKYGVLMILFTFLTFFFIDSIAKRRVPMIGYVLTGLAILLFYTLLLSVSEYLPFGWSYLIAAGAITIMISLYLRGFVQSKYPTLICAGILAILYTFLYVILQMESFPLLVGSLFLFIVLGLIMWLSQKLEW